MYIDACLNSPEDSKQLSTMILRAIQLGYRSLVLNHVVNDNFQPLNNCKTASPKLDVVRSILNSEQIQTILRQQSLNPSNIKIYKRITIVAQKEATLLKLKPDNQNMKQFDIVAVAPQNEQVFKTAVAHSEVEVIQMPSCEDWGYRARVPNVRGCIKRGIKFELCYGEAFQGIFGDMDLIHPQEGILQPICGI
ncbi:MAG: hypothetical protein EZS28_042922 [Streblomastix strix]|uniref:Uncharacterized protein n=1 Tax=Streblomastix strix TaxID=222440 RepID=A0A5J4TUC8_9EUKA|nr:MAG: hypothetical protein EZS28_042922 [Streblomastix strix]